MRKRRSGSAESGRGTSGLQRTGGSGGRRSMLSWRLVRLVDVRQVHDGQRVEEYGMTTELTSRSTSTKLQHRVVHRYGGCDVRGRRIRGSLVCKVLASDGVIA